MKKPDIFRKGISKFLGKRGLAEKVPQGLSLQKLTATAFRKASLAALIVFSLVFFSLQLFSPSLTPSAFAASAYTWAQNAWTGGADTVNFPSHPGNKTGWNKYFSKDSTISDTSGISLTSPSTSFTDNTTAAFSAGTQSNTSAYNNQALLLKPNGASATNAWECVADYVSGGVCAKWGSYDGRSGTALAGKRVWGTDVYGTKLWKNSYSYCVGPQCATGLDPNYPGNHALVASNSVDFSLYTARNACKNLGGRLPYMNELLEIYAGKVSYGNNFQSNVYWSATEASSVSVYYVNFSNGYAGIVAKTGNLYVRCVR